MTPQLEEAAKLITELDSIRDLLHEYRAHIATAKSDAEFASISNGIKLRGISDKITKAYDSILSLKVSVNFLIDTTTKHE